MFFFVLLVSFCLKVVFFVFVIGMLGVFLEESKEIVDNLVIWKFEENKFISFWLGLFRKEVSKKKKWNVWKVSVLYYRV